VENCQVGVFLTYAGPAGQALIDRELDLPAEWAADADRRVEAGVPEHVEFATKPELARRMIERTLTAGVPFSWVAADTVYGVNPHLRRWLEAHRIAYVLAVPCDFTVVAGAAGEVEVRTVTGRIPDRVWERRSVGAGAKGIRLFDWATIEVTMCAGGAQGGQLAAAGFTHLLLVRRGVADRTDLAFFLVHVPVDTTLAAVVAAWGARWVVEECFKIGKSECGLDHYEVRRWDGWYRHMTLVMLALGVLVAIRTAETASKGAPKQDEPG
jgi:SRSO17 transposase